MVWPLATDYSAAIQNPGACFSGADLAGGAPAVADMLLGLPLTYAGNNACVYRLDCPGDQHWAVKCFTRQVPDLQARYHQISRHLERHKKKFAVEFHYLEHGIRVSGEWYPVLKMCWVEGSTLNEFLRDHAGNASLMDQLGHLWLRLATELREARMAHGDLQHGNVLLVPGSKASAMVLRLIDYDGLWVPELDGQPPGEVGHPNYQHPQRLAEGGYHAEIDRFALLVICTAIRCLEVGGKALWDRHDNGENLLFREADFRDPARSRLFPELLALPDADAQALAGHLLDSSQRPLEQVPLLSELVENGSVRPLSADQVDRLRELVPGFRPARALPPPIPARRVLPPPPILDALPADEEPRPRPLLWPGPPAWLLRLGLRPNGPLGRIWPVTLGTALGMPLFALVVWLFWPSTRPLASPSAPIVAMPSLLPVDPVHIRAGGTALVSVVVERPFRTGPLRVELLGLPDGVTCSGVEVAEGDGPARLQLTLQSMPGRDGVTAGFTVILSHGGEKLHEQRADLTVTRFDGPRLGDVTPEPIELIRGVSLTVIAQVDIPGNQGPQSRVAFGSTALRFDYLPVGVSQAPPRKALRAGEVGVELLTATGLGEMTARVVVVLLADGIACDRKLLMLSIVDPKRDPMVDLALPTQTRLEAGGKARLDVRLTRFHHDGPVTLRLAEKPAGVSAADVTVPAGQDAGEMILEAAPGAAGPLEWALIRVQALVEGKPVGQKTGDLRLVAAKPAAPRALPAIGLPLPAAIVVSVPTGDSLTLSGTFYPAREKKAPCILLLHDLAADASRSHPGWVRLARALQAQGCSVLTLDFRGFGDSARQPLPKAFWKVPPNKKLHTYLRQMEGASQGALDGRQLLTYTQYLPWLVQDVVAARLWLDLKHDEGEVSSQNLFVVGAGSGAQLGLIWLATEARRCKTVSFPFLRAVSAEGQDVLGCVCIDLAPLNRGSLQAGKPPLDSLRRESSLPPIALIYDREVTASGNIARALARSLELRPGPGGELPVEGQGARGMSLAARDETVKAVVGFVADVMKQNQARSWVKRDVEVSNYNWVLSASRTFPAKPSGSRMPSLAPLNEWGFPAHLRISD